MASILAAKGQLDYLWTVRTSNTAPAMIQHIERQFVRTSRPLYSHLVGLLESAISRGDFPSGARVPPERELAQRLGISRTTVVSAYRELESRGLLRGYVGRGTFVCAAPDPSGAPFAWRGKIAAAALRTATRSCATRSGTRRTRKCSRWPPENRRSTAFPWRRFSTPSSRRSSARDGRCGGMARRKGSRCFATPSPNASASRPRAC